MQWRHARYCPIDEVILGIQFVHANSVVLESRAWPMKLIGE